MIYEENKIISNKYKLLKDYSVTGYVVNYIGEFENNKYYISEFIDKNLVENETALKYYDESYLNFWKKISFLENQSLKEIPKVVEIIEDEKKLVVYKKSEAQNINDYLISREKNFNYKEAYTVLKKYFLSLDIAARKEIFFDIENFTLKNDNNEIFIEVPFDLRIDKDTTIKAMTNLYYKLITGISFYETLKKPSEFNVVIPKDLEIFLEEVLLEKKTFFSVESFNNKFRDLVEYSMTEKKPENKVEKVENEEVKMRKQVSGCFIILAIALIAVTIMYIGVLRITKSVFNNSLNNYNNSSEDIYETPYDIVNEEDFFYNYNMEYVDVNLDGMICETEDFLFYNLYRNDVSNLYKENKLTKKIEVIFEDIVMNYMTIFEDTIYFANGSDGYKLYSIKTDGSELTSINEKKVSFIQIESKGNVLYYVTLSSDKVPSIYKIDMELDTDEAYESDYEIIKKYMDMYDFFKKLSVDKSVGMYFDPGYFMYNIRPFKNNMIGMESYRDGDKLVYVNSKGERDMVPFNIDTVEFEIMNDNKIIYIDNDSSEIKSFDFETREYSNIYGEVYSLINVTEDYIFVIDKNEKLILKLYCDKNTEDKKAHIIEQFDINYN